MIRMKGFARKTRRLTKGGSLSSSVDMRVLGNSILRCFSREKLSGALGSEQSSENGIMPSGLNGSQERVKPDAQRGRLTIDSSANGLTSDDDNVSSFLQNAIVGLVSSKRPGDVDLDLPIRMPRWKRLLDLGCIFLTLPFWLPLMILVMLWIRIASSGPVFYRQERVGHRRNCFMIFKFRTMHVNAETRTHEEYFAYLMRVDCPMTKLDEEGDSRLIPGGRFLRASGLDELPQIFNVLRGEMSLVGPRPCLPNEFQRYEAWHQRRVNVLPGLTGYWQVNGKNKTTFNEMIAMDIFYAHNMSLWVDLTIMLKTIPALMGQALEPRENSRDGSRQQAIRETSPITGRLNGSVRKI
jgi:lipopolysaccharide/colanic/teichoic acid biosynthesis glycosyltransferase